MFKFAALISVLLVIGAESQRPPYAGRPKPYPQVLDRFKPDIETSTTTTTTTPNANVGNRVGEDNAVPSGGVQPTAAPAAPTGPTTTTTPSPLPLDELGFADAIKRVEALPENQQPYWYINRHQIAQHLNSSPNRVVQPETPTRSFFAG